MISAAVAALTAATAGSAMAAGPTLTNPYVSVFGGYAIGKGTVNANGFDYDINNSNNNIFYEFQDVIGNVGNGWLLGMAVGANLSDSVRGEVEISHARLETSTSGMYTEYNSYNNGNNIYNYYNTTNITKDNLSATFLMANLWYDIDMGSSITPYIGGGVGAAYVDGHFYGNFNSNNDPANYYDLHASGWAPAFQVGGGLKVAVSPNMDLDFGYRYKQVVDVGVSTSTDSEVESYTDDISGYRADSKMNFGVHVLQAGLTVHF